MIEVTELTKRYGQKLAIDGVSFTAEPGKVTGFVGPNGAGKTTTMRCILGLDRPTSGSAKVDGKSLVEHAAPAHVVGAMLEARSVHRGRTARNHLLSVAATHAIEKTRVDEVIALTGLGSVQNQRVGKFSLGMGQRLGIATALLGDPDIIIFDEPTNGLDPEGVHWLRSLLRHYADQGRTVLFSSHNMAEMEAVADNVVFLGRGKVLRKGSVQSILSGSDASDAEGTHTLVPVTIVRTPKSAELTALLANRKGVRVEHLADDRMRVTGIEAAALSELAVDNRIALHELSPQRPTLEQTYLDLTKDDVEYHSVNPDEIEHGEIEDDASEDAASEASDETTAVSEESAHESTEKTATDEEGTR